MKVTRITRCANIECPNKPHEGTMTTTQIATREGRPRSITLVLCGPCSDYLGEAKADAIKLAVDAARSELKRNLYAVAYGGSVVKPPRELRPKTYTLVGGPGSGQRHAIPHGHRVWRIARRIDPAHFMSASYDYRPTPIRYDEYERAYFRGRGNCVAYVHSEEFGKINCVWVRA